MEFDKTQYDEFVAASEQGTLFCKSWWLDVVAPGRHQVLWLENGSGDIDAAWPIVWQRSRFPDRVINMAPLTPWLGILYRPATSFRLANRLAREKDWTEELIGRLPRYDALYANFHRNFGYWSPLYWRGFSQTTRYTFVLDDLSDLEAIWAGLRENIRTDVRKARRQGVVVDTIEDPEVFWRVYSLTFQRQRLPVPCSLDLMRRVDTACRAHDARRILVARGEDGEIHAAAYVVWDDRSAYYLMGGGNPSKRKSGATSLLVWEAIRFASMVAKTFDFEGSMLEPVDRFFRAFGAQPQPYSAISKVNTPVYRTARDVARWVRGRIGAARAG